MKGACIKNVSLSENVYLSGSLGDLGFILSMESREQPSFDRDTKILKRLCHLGP